MEDMTCTRCGNVAERGLSNPSKGRVICEDCLGVLLRPIGTKPSEDVKVTFPDDGRVLFYVESDGG